MSRAWIAFYMGDYDKDTQALTTLEHGAYFLLLKQCWVHGSIPLEPAKRANIAKLSLREWNKVAPAINPFFDHEGRNKRATKEIERAEAVRLRRSVAGHLGGKASGTSKAIAKHERSKREANAKQTSEQNTKHREANHSSKIITTTSIVEGQQVAEKVRAKPPHLLSRAELEASFAKARAP